MAITAKPKPATGQMRCNREIRGGNAGTGEAISSASTDMTETLFFIVEVLDLSRLVCGICIELLTLSASVKDSGGVIWRSRR